VRPAVIEPTPAGLRLEAARGAELPGDFAPFLLARPDPAGFAGLEAAGILGVDLSVLGAVLAAGALDTPTPAAFIGGTPLADALAATIRIMPMHKRFMGSPGLASRFTSLMARSKKHFIARRIGDLYMLRLNKM